MSNLKISQISFSYSDKTILKNLSLQLNKGEITCLIGESGSGKTTLLRIISGLDRQDSGIISYGNETIADDKIFTETHLRNIGLVVQERALFPHLNIIENICFGLNSSKREKIKRGRELMDKFNILKYESFFPHQISSGEQQRVALARALAPSPRVILMDEPFSSLDRALKFALRNETKEILKNENITALLVSHDFNDALEVADKLAIIHEGSIIQVGEPRSVVLNPINKYIKKQFVCETGDILYWKSVINGEK